MSSTKSATGHLLGAAGAIEAIFLASWPSATRSRRRPSISTIRSVETATSISSRTRRKPRKIDVALSNSFGFGGTNASLILQRYVA
jgi:3-oxoacyl-[acyl-carrier-protein] synthase II